MQCLYGVISNNQSMNPSSVHSPLRSPVQSRQSRFYTDLFTLVGVVPCHKIASCSYSLRTVEYYCRFRDSSPFCCTLDITWQQHLYVARATCFFFVFQKTFSGKSIEYDVSKSTLKQEGFTRCSWRPSSISEQWEEEEELVRWPEECVEVS